MPNAQLLIIDDEEDIRMLLSRILKLEDYSVSTAANAREGLRLAEDNEYFVCICDVRLPDADGIELTRKLKGLYPAMEIIQLTAHGNIADGVKSIKNGAYDYITKGDNNNRIIPLVERAFEKAKAQYRLLNIQKRGAERYGIDRIIGKSDAIERAKRMANQVAETDATVLLTGPTGTGKEIFAHAIHYASKRSAESFVVINCAAISKDLLESEMFGHVAGAFTGATKSKKGFFQEADCGTIFLDELGEMDLNLQAKLLRVLENGTFIPVGSTKENKIDVRIIAATNKDLLKESEEGRFRLDLYYRLSTFAIDLPGLNTRGEDILLLASHFLEEFAISMNRAIKGMSRNFEQALLKHQWRGNVRELRNFMERSIILAQSSELTAADLPIGFAHNDIKPSPSIAALKDLPAIALSDVERLHIQRVMTMTGGNKSRTAELLGIGLTTLYRKLEEYNGEKKD